MLFRSIQQKIEQAEKQIALLQQKQAECDVFLSQESAYSPENKAKLQEILAQSAKIKVELENLEENWLAWQEELEQILAAIDAELS